MTEVMLFYLLNVFVTHHSVSAPWYTIGWTFYYVFKRFFYFSTFSNVFNDFNHFPTFCVLYANIALTAIFSKVSK